MSKWKSATLGDISSVITGPFGSQLHQSDYTDKGIASIMPQNIGERTVNLNEISHISKSDATRLKRFIVYKDDIVYSRRGDVEKHAFITAELSGALCGTGCLRVRFNSNFIYPEFISLYLDRPESKTWIRQHAVGSSMPNLNSGLLADVPVKYPDYEEQVLIAKCLCSIEQKIALNKRINAELEALAKTIYDYWFVQFDFPDENGKPYRTSGGAMEYNDQLKRKIPKGWKVGNLYAIADYINGLACQNFRPANNEAALPVVKIREMHEGISLDTECVSANIPKNKQINDGDILFSWSATLEVMYWIGGCAGLNQHIFKVVPKAAYPKEYVFHQLSEYVVNFVKMAEARKTTMGHITSDHIEQSRIVLPHKRILECFSTTASPIHQQIVNGMIENLELTRLRDWLLPMLMNGQATVADEQPMETPQNVVEMPGNDKRFDLWLQNQGIAARGDLDKKTLREIFDAMDDDDK